MVGIVIVSHSARLAEGVKELATQMAQREVPLATAGGIDDPEHPIGTDALKVKNAIESVYSEDGVLVLMDLGSALLSAEMALEFLSPEQREHVRLCPAPLVEGALAAVVQASIGADLEAVYNEALGALEAKQQQMPESVAPTRQQEDTPAEVDEAELRLTVRNKLGLHARPAAQFVTTANRFASTITIRKGKRTANGKSINQVATLGVRQGEEIVVSASGPDSAEALTELQSLVKANFGEEEAIEAEATVAAAATRATTGKVGRNELTGIPASPGIAIGPVAQYRPRMPQVELREVANPSAEWRRLQNAIDEARAEIEALRQRVTEQGNQAEAAIFLAHDLILQDQTVLDAVKMSIFEQKMNAGAVWQQEVEALAEDYRALDDEYMRARAGDILDVGQRVLRRLLGLSPTEFKLEQPSILLASDLTPSDTAQLDPERVLGICTELGGATSHSAILARAFAIPAIVGLGPKLADIPEGKNVAVNGGTGQVWLEPDAALLDELRAQREDWLSEQAVAKATSQQPAETKDGHHLEIAANIGGVNDVAVALEYGAEGVGLFRTEFLFLDRETAPSEEDQYIAYRRVAAAMGDRPVIIRTLDVGGDKPLPYLPVPEEANPFLGWRGIRFCLDRPDIFRPQLRAILRTTNNHNVKLMFPMVSTLGELREAKRLLRDVMAEMAAEGIPFRESMEIGIMIEVPAAVATGEQLAREVNFFSIGTNDLTQYVMAADRGNAQVADLANALQPAVLRMIEQTVRAGHDAGIWVGICGELAGNALVTPVLVGLGLDELSMNAPSIPAVKEVIRTLTLEEAHEIATTALAKESALAVENYLKTLNK